MSVWTWGIIGVGIIIVIIGIVIALRLYLSHLVEQRIAAYQSDLIVRHYEEVQNMYREMRGWRHDYHSHIQTMKAYRSSGENEKLDEYLNHLTALNGENISH